MVLVVFAAGATACAEDGAGSGAVASGPDLSALIAIGAASTPATGPVPGDFGSRYIGAPVAFWFWAPY